MSIDRSAHEGSRYPASGIACGGNDIPPIPWLRWMAAAPALGAIAWLLSWHTVHDSFAAYTVAVVVALVTLAMPLRLRGYELPKPAPLRISYSGMWVYLGERGRWRIGSYVHLPWDTIVSLALYRSGVRVRVNGDGRNRVPLKAGRLGESLSDTGSVNVELTPRQLTSRIHGLGEGWLIGGP